MSLLERIRGVRRIIGMLLTTAGMTTMNQHPLVGNILVAGGVILVLFDPSQLSMLHVLRNMNYQS